MARMILPQDAGTKRIVSALGDCRFVGGCVRDALAGLAAKDVDLATPHTPEDVTTKLEAAGIKVIPTGIAHGTVTAVADEAVVEITTLRRDVATNGRRATIAYTEDWQADAARRDFTINALYADPATGEIYDYFGGLDDLAAGRVRFIGDALQRIAEDHLRILRFFRFSARFAKGTLDAEGLAACTARSKDLMALSRERVAMELLALLALDDPAPTVAIMIAHQIFESFAPEVTEATSLARLVEREGQYHVAADPVRRLSALLPPDAPMAEDVASRLKLSNAQKKRLILVAGRNGEDATNPQALAYRYGAEVAIDRLLLGDGNPAPLRDWSPPKFPLTGGDIIALGVSAGPEVARLLQATEAQWVSEHFPDEVRARKIAAEIVASHGG